MLFDQFPGRTVKELVYDAGMGEAALPSWLVPTGTSPIITFNDVGVTTAGLRPGTCRIQTKAATPTAGDMAGVQLGTNIAFGSAVVTNSPNFEEVTFGVSGVKTDGGSADTQLELAITNTIPDRGIYVLNNTSGITQVRIYPGTVKSPPYPIAADGNNTIAKGLFVTIRPRTKEVFVSEGDPYKSGKIWFYDKGTWINFSGFAPRLQVVTRSAAQRYLEFEKFLFRVVMA